MTDILIPLGKGSRHQDFELRMCLRSIEKHLKGVGNIFLVGEKPDWIKNVIHIPARDNPNNWNRARNIYDKIMAGCSTESVWYLTEEGQDNIQIQHGLSDNFLFVNDDHFLLTDYEASEFPYYHRGEFNLQELHDGGNMPQYKQTLNTFKYGFDDGYDFDVHCPILFNRNFFKTAFSQLPEKWPEHGILIKSHYTNYCFDTSKWVPCEDLKFSQPLMKESIYQALEDRSWFSIGDRCLKSGAMKEVLQELYPNKSKYEK
jgi:hypothetical protein